MLLTIISIIWWKKVSIVLIVWKNIMIKIITSIISYFFTDVFQFLSFSLDSLVKNLGKNEFQYLSQEFNNNVLDLVKQ